MKYKTLFNYVFAVLISLSILTPAILQYFKIFLLTGCFILCYCILIQKKNDISKAAITLSLFYALLGLFWALYGLSKNNPGAAFTMTVMVTYPLVLPVLACCYHSSDSYKLHKLIILLSMLLAVADLVYIHLSISQPDNFFTQLISLAYEDAAVIDNADDYFRFSIPNISSAIFLLAFTTASAIATEKLRKTSIFASLLLIAVIVLSGRRAGFITPIAGVALSCLLFYRKLYRKDLIRIFSWIMFTGTLLLMILFILTEFYESSFYFDLVTSIFNFSDNESNIIRKEQFNALWDEFKNSPLIGEGAGAAISYVRSEEQPWAYELSYMAFLFQYGLLGFSFYAAGILVLLLTLIKRVRSLDINYFEFSFLAGFISFMLANATNPYLAKFDYMWVIFIPIALLNLTLINKIGR